MVAEARRPAGNAMKHGLCSHLLLLEENSERVEMIRQDLIDCYKPRLHLEDKIINELAIAQFKVRYGEQVRYERMREERQSAGGIFDKRLQAQNDEYVEKWRNAPLDNVVNVRYNMFGARMFLDLWSDIRALAESEIGTIPLDKILDACLTLGSHWHLQRITRQGRHLMGLFLATTPDYEKAMETWVERCGGDCREMNVVIAQEIYCLAPSRDEARRQLAEVARVQVEALESQSKQVKAEYDYEREQFIATSCGLGLGDKERTNNARLFMRYHTADQNRADKLEKRLDYLKLNRARHRAADRDESFYEESDATFPSQDRSPKNQQNGMHIQQAPQAEPVKTKPKLTFEELDQLMRESIREKLAAKLGIAITPPPLSKAQQAKLDKMMAAIPPGCEPEYRDVDWARNETVTPEQREMMEKLSVMEDGPERERLVRQYFGTAELLMHAYGRFFKCPD